VEKRVERQHKTVEQSEVILLKELFNDILTIEDVKGIMLFSSDGNLVFREFLFPLIDNFENMNSWGVFIDSLNGIREADFVFENVRLYVRKASSNYLMILMGAFCSIAMVRLNCDILLPSLKQAGTTKGLKGFLKKKVF
jgi:hypothetical protein